MIDKKIIIGIIIFVVGGMFIYSFANPLEDNGLDSDGTVVDSTDSTSTIDNESSDTITEEIEQTDTSTVEVSNETKSSVVKVSSTKTSTKQNSTSTSTNSNNSSTPTTAEPTPVAPVRSTVTKFSYVSDDNLNVTYNRIGNEINYIGKVKADQDGTYSITIVISAPEELSSEEIVNSKALVYNNPSSGFYRSDRFEITFKNFQSLENNSYNSIPITVYWGYGEPVVYTINLKIEAIKNVE